MKMRMVLAAGTFMLSGMLAVGTAQAQEFDTAEECMASGSVLGGGLPTCTRSGNGPWVASYPGDPSSSGQGDAAAGAVVLFLFWFGLMGGLPAFISYKIASERGSSAGLAAVLGFFLSWIGLIIVYVAFKPEVEQAARNVVRNAADPEWRLPRAGGEGARPAGRDAASRIAELDRLKGTGLISESEYATRREKILNEI